MDSSFAQLFSLDTSLDADWHEQISKNAAAILALQEHSLPENKDEELFAIVKGFLRHYSPAGWQAYIDEILPDAVSGWAKRIDAEESQFISLDLNGETVYECFLADAIRADVHAAGFGHGGYGFCALANPLSVNGLIWATLREPFSTRIIAFRLHKPNSA